MPTHTGSKNRSGPTKHTRGKKNKGKVKQEREKRGIVDR